MKPHTKRRELNSGEQVVRGEIFDRAYNIGKQKLKRTCTNGPQESDAKLTAERWALRAAILGLDQQ